jgi:hypothetical protein
VLPKPDAEIPLSRFVELANRVALIRRDIPPIDDGQEMTPVDLIGDDTRRWRRIFAKHLRGTGFESLVKPTGQNLREAEGIDLSEAYVLMLAILRTVESITDLRRGEGYRTFKRSPRSYYQELSPHQTINVTFPEKLTFIIDTGQSASPAGSIYRTWTKFVDAIQSTRLSLVRRCQSCGEFFFAGREDQKACSGRCNGRRRSRKLRERRMHRVLELQDKPLDEIARQLQRDGSAGRRRRKDGGAAFYLNEVHRYVATLKRRGVWQPRFNAIASPSSLHPRNE